MTRTFRGATRLLLSFLLLLCSFAVLAQSLPRTTGEQKTAVILVNFQDDASQPISPSAAHALVFGTVSDFYWEASYRRTFLSGDTYGWFTIPVSRTVCDIRLVSQEADKAAAAAGVNLAAYDRLVYLAPQNSCSVTGYNSGATLPSRSWLFTNNFNAYIVAHELGHNFGLSHSQALDCGASVLGADCINRSYGDAADTMGSGVTPHFNAFQKELLGWLGAEGAPAITTVAGSGRYQIAPLATTGTASKALKIPRGVDALTGEMNYYYVEYRQPVGFDAVLGSAGNLARGVLVHTGGVNQFSMLLDMTPNSDTSSSFNDIRDSALEVGRSYVDATAGVTITLVSADANGATVDVTVGGGQAPACTRSAPVLAVSGPTSAVAAGTTLTYTVNLTNKDSGACPATTFNLARSVPSGWTGVLATTTLSLSPGASGSTTLAVTSPSSAAAGSYGIGVGTSSSAGSVHTANASATYTVATTASAGTLTGTVGTDKTSYARGETVYMSALVKRDGVPVAGAAVQFKVASPTGTTSTYNATTGSDGFARASFKLGKAKSSVGTWSVRADASKDGASATATASFGVR